MATRKVKRKPKAPRKKAAPKPKERVRIDTERFFSGQ